jgi:hypothetical protein
MPYDSITQATDANFPTKIDDVGLSLEQVNHLARIYDALKEAKRTDNPMAVAINQFKKIYKIEGGKWVKAETMQENSLLKRLIALIKKEGIEIKDDESSVNADPEMQKFSADELIQGKPQLVLLPRATHTAKGHKRVSFTEKDLQRMEENYNAGYRPGIPDGMSADFPGDLVDVDHNAAFPDGSGSMVQKPDIKIGRIAAGWISRLKYIKESAEEWFRGSGLYALPLWIRDIYDNYIVTKKLQGISSYVVTDYHDEKTNKNVGPMFVNFTLTNDPQYPLPVVLGRGDDSADDYIRTYHSFDKEEKEKEEDFMEKEKLIEIFKLKADATDEEVDQALTGALESKEKFEKLSERFDAVCEKLGIEGDEKEGVQDAIEKLQKRPEPDKYEALKKENEDNAKRIENLEAENFDSKVKARYAKAEASNKVKPAWLKRDDNEGDEYIMSHILSKAPDADKKFDQLLDKLPVLPELEGPKGNGEKPKIEALTKEDKELMDERGWTAEELKEYKNPETAISFTKEPVQTQ